MTTQQVIFPVMGLRLGIATVSRNARGTGYNVGDPKGKNVFMFFYQKEPSGVCPILVPDLELTFKAPVGLKKKNGHSIVGRVARLERGHYEDVPDWLLQFDSGSVFMQELAPGQMTKISAFPRLSEC